MPGNNLTLTSANYDTSAEKFGAGALNSGYATAPAGLVPSFPFTIECWFKRSSAPGSLEVIMGQQTVAYVAMTTAGLASFNVGGTGVGTVNSSSSVADGNWHHAALVCTSASSFSAYLDGALLGNGVPGAGVSFAVTANSPYQGYMGFKGYGGNTAYTFGGEVDEAVIWLANKYTAAFTAPTSAYSGNEGMAALYHFDGNGNDSSVASTMAIAPNNAALVYSPANWNATALSAITINGGARMRTTFTGASCALNFDLSKMVAAAQSKIRYRIDGEHNPWNYVTLTSGNATVTCAMPSDMTAYPRHQLELEVVSTTEFVAPAGTAGQRWDPTSAANAAVVFTGLTLASGGAVYAPSLAGLKGLFLGDSITEGYLTVNNTATADTDRSDSTLGWAAAQARLLGAEVGVAGFGGQAWGAAGVGGVPAFPSTWGFLYSGVARSLAGLDFLVINMGENDGTNAVTSTITSTLNAILAAAPATCALYVMRPFSGKQTANLQAGIAATTTPARFAYLDTTGLFDTTQSVDGTHPNGSVNASTIAPGVAALIRAASKPPLVTPLGADAVSLVRSDGSSATATLANIKAYLSS